MRWVTRVTAPILLADVGDYRFRVFSLDLKRSDERIFGVHGDVVRLPFQFKPDGEGQNLNGACLRSRVSVFSNSHSR